ncbi:hypothetical protein EPUS_04021 [Endocarpon pusillum Z07020]|uniref:Mediator of RNA polymerase II transcription subunit 6 n=1 Tax=Endocarpon pusillum (strain Z07020 / HMAS-L-300199) TaxID=1263415 RepID=U1GC90_ENDPU|nr:uncharacterized protein EPUS_04021 [Endocarpon pusillum Z07020]ERF69316.1 hypothetical protein EPUS_04021 [Endocarpon pusillum Z07020]
METEQEQKLDELFYRDSQWIADNGRYVHENNVLFYFAQSPFFDRQSNNNSVFLQAISDPRFSNWLATRENFEAQLRRIAGTEYVVTHDPIASKVRYKDGEFSNIWVIQKQARRKRPGQEDEVTPLAMYYIVGDAIYQAPTIAKLIGNRMLSTVTSLNKLLATAAPLPLYSAAYGHTYLTPSQKASNPKQTGLSQQSREDTPMPDVQSATQPMKSASNHDYSEFEDTQMFLEALNLSSRYGKEYMDDAPLVGEPGNFRTSKVRDTAAPPKETPSTDRQPSAQSKEKSPAPSPPPPIQTDVPQAVGKKSAKGGDRSPTTPGGREKPKRRKSRPAVTPTEA